MDRDTSNVASLLDRLIDDDPTGPPEAIPFVAQDARELRRSVARDLEAMLNTRQEALAELPPAFEEVGRSLLVYGMPDLTAFSLANHRDRARMRQFLERAITTFEPRLERVRVIAEQSDRGHDQILRFRVEAWLRMQPAPEQVAFDTVLQLETKAYSVTGDA
jgi:type VI secretion system protein ImpF